MRWKCVFLSGLVGLLSTSLLVALAGQDIHVRERPSIDETAPAGHDGRLLVSSGRPEKLKTDPISDGSGRSALWRAIERVEHESSAGPEQSGRRLTSEQLLELREQVRHSAAPSKAPDQAAQHR